jgi:5-methylcytosine-specific restriction endonuclease McrA
VVFGLTRQREVQQMTGSKPRDEARLDRIVAEARRAREAREKSYRDQALKIYPWVCGRCARTFDRANVHLLTVHHRDHNHDHNPADGSNWELLCLYCHENEHARELDNAGRSDAAPGDLAPPATHRPFAGLEALLKTKK